MYDVWHRIMPDPEYCRDIRRGAREMGIDLCANIEEAGNFIKIDRRYIMTNLELVLKEEGLLDGLLKRAQEVGMTLVDYLRLASDVAPAVKRGGAVDEEEVDPVLNAAWERMMSDPTYFSTVSRRARAQGIDFCDTDGMEARELCRD